MDHADARAVAPGIADDATLIAIAFYRNPQLVAPVLASLESCVDEMTALRAELVLYNDSPDDAALSAELARRATALGTCVSYRIETNPQNLGFVRTMNRAISEAVARRRNLLLLNSDTRVEPGALTEMHRVLHADPMIAFVNPRSNNATIATLPIAARIGHLPQSAQREAYDAFAGRLPPWSFAPTSVGFCMLIRWDILAEFGGFDEIYGSGYNEENDLVMRAARCGYRAALANRAFVWHDGEASFGVAAQTRAVLEARNRAILDRRYPEYTRYTAAYADSPEAAAERLLATLIPDAAGKTGLAFDFSSFRTDHNGTFRAGRQLLEAAAALWTDRFRLAVIAPEEIYAFHDYAATGVPRSDPHAPECFAAIIRVGQPYDWNAVQRLAMRGAVVVVMMLDAISIDCPQLFSPRLYNMWQFTLDHADVLITQSRHTEQQFAARFRLPPDLLRIVSHHSLAVADYALPPAPEGPRSRTLLVLGNHFHHKDVGRTAAALAAGLPERQIVALGQRAPSSRQPPDPMAPEAPRNFPNLRLEPAGERTEAEIGAAYASAEAVIFPSHAEGFGFPLLHALAARRPVFVRRLPVFAELATELDGNPNIHFYETTAALIEHLRTPPAWIDTPLPASGNDGLRAAREVRAALEAAIPNANYRRITDRVRAMHFASDVGGTGGATGPGSTPPAQAAHFVAENVERAARVVLAFPPAYAAARLAFRVARRVAKALWH